ncbi:hypothetical protein GCM10009021_30030 [Halarchaeum nitratireducens]|uniref:Uncharacterized protein n=1 Tax=Halarchaeum nitratireducens TaxID=489913 RepID=A0A830GFJ7_9EURY|nr:hypothetical protein GCM10009021_30030 [Halarchaeum nitratireducens]
MTHRIRGSEYYSSDYYSLIPNFGASTDESTLIAGEAKFTNTPLGYDVFADLEDDVAQPLGTHRR